MIAKEVEYKRALKDGGYVTIRTTRWIPEDEDKYKRMCNYLNRKESVKKAKDDTKRSEMINEVYEEKRIMEAFSEFMEMLNI